MALPVFPPANEIEKQKDAADDLKKGLAEVAKQMAKMSAGDAPALVAQLKQIAKAADGAGPALAKLFAASPDAAKSLRKQFQSIIDGASEMVARVREKVAEGEQAAAKAGLDKRDSTARGVARVVRGVPSFSGGGGAGVTAGVGSAVAGAVDAGVGAATAALAAVGPEGEVAAVVIKKIAEEIEKAAAALGQFIAMSVKAANPGVWDRYERSLEDLSSVFGQALTPVVQEATDFADKLNASLGEIAPVIADLVAEVVGDFKPVLESLLPIIAQLADGFKGAWQEWGPAFKSIMEAIAASMIAVNKTAQLLINTLAILSSNRGLSLGDALRDARALQGILDAQSKSGQKTFAARPAEFSDIEGIGKSVQAAAASAGVGPEGKTKTAEQAVNELVTKAGAIFDKIAAGVDFLEKIADAAAHPINTAVGAASNTAAGFALTAINAASAARQRARDIIGI